MYKEKSANSAQVIFPKVHKTWASTCVCNNSGKLETSAQTKVREEVEVREHG